MLGAPWRNERRNNASSESGRPALATNIHTQDSVLKRPVNRELRPGERWVRLDRDVTRAFASTFKPCDAFAMFLILVSNLRLSSRINCWFCSSRDPLPLRGSRSQVNSALDLIGDATKTGSAMFRAFQQACLGTIWGQMN
jgi:hypothetical protein